MAGIRDWLAAHLSPSQPPDTAHTSPSPGAAEDRAWADYAAGRDPDSDQAAAMHDEWQRVDDEFADADWAARVEAAEMCGPPTSDYQAGQADGQAARGEYWQELAERAGAEEKTDAAGREWYADDTSWADSPDNPANYQAGGGCERYADDDWADQGEPDRAATDVFESDIAAEQAQQQEDAVVNGPLAEDHTRVGGLDGSFNTDDDRAIIAQEQAYDRVAADQATIAAYGFADDQRAGWYGGDGRGDGYGANGTAADYEIVQLEDAADHGY